nr:MAG TPA: hypothetical protein [Caudoviricetes sp.]
MRLIDADALEDKFGCSDADILAKEEIRDAPTIDAVPVVRCKECTHLYGAMCAVCGLLPRKPDDFCSYGERKDGGAEDD